MKSSDSKLFEMMPQRICMTFERAKLRSRQSSMERLRIMKHDRYFISIGLLKLRPRCVESARQGDTSPPRLNCKFKIQPKS